jgi:hypothetical protein
MATVIRERYAAAVHSRSLTVDEKTVYSDTDVLGAYGIADRNLTRGHDSAYARGDKNGRTFTPAPLAVPLERLFSGDHKAAHEIVRILAEMAFYEARRLNVRMGQGQAHDMACATLAWFRNGRCDPCGGRGKPAIPNSPVLAAHDCEHCQGTGKIPFRSQFRHEWKPIADWLREGMEAESSRAAPHAMRALAERMDF